MKKIIPDISNIKEMLPDIIKWSLIFIIAGIVFYVAFPKYHFTSIKGRPIYRCNKITGNVERIILKKQEGFKINWWPFKSSSLHKEQKPGKPLKLQPVKTKKEKTKLRLVDIDYDPFVEPEKAAVGLSDEMGIIWDDTPLAEPESTVATELPAEQTTQKLQRVKIDYDPFEEPEGPTARDGTLIAYATGVVSDKNTGLEWFAGPDRNTNWNEAKQWVENLTVAGGGWRMPTREELKTLFKKGAEERNMTPLLKTTGLWVWSGETRSSSSAWVFSFYFGAGDWFYRSNPYNGRGFAVRSRR